VYRGSGRGTLSTEAVYNGGFSTQYPRGSSTAHNTVLVSVKELKEAGCYMGSGRGTTWVQMLCNDSRLWGVSKDLFHSWQYGIWERCKLP